MGLDYTTYIGPYVRCKTKKVASAKKISTCSNADCESYCNEYWVITNKKFCDTCGSPIQDRMLPIEVANVNAAEVQLDFLKDALCFVSGNDFESMKGDHIWLSNRRMPDGTRDYSFDSRECNQHALIDAELIENEKHQFAAFYEKEIFILGEKYGNIEVEWGLIHHIS